MSHRQWTLAAGSTHLSCGSQEEQGVTDKKVISKETRHNGISDVKKQSLIYVNL